MVPDSAGHSLCQMHGTQKANFEPWDVWFLGLIPLLVLSFQEYVLCLSLGSFSHGGWFILVAGYFLSHTVILFVPSMAYHGCFVIINRVLKLFSYFVPPPTNQRLHVMVDAIVMSSCILLLRYAWSFLPTRNLAGSLVEEANSNEL